MPGDSILVVDDHEFNTRAVAFILKAAGYVALTASGASELEALLENHVPCLILMDLEMPEVDGYELTRRIKSDPRTQGVVVVAFTTVPAEEGADRARTAGCDGYITKTADLHSLPHQIEKYLERGASAARQS